MILFRKLEAWRYGAIFRRATRNDTQRDLEDLWGISQEMDARLRDLERREQLVTHLLNYGMIAGACKSVTAEQRSNATITINAAPFVDIPGTAYTYTPDYAQRLHVTAIFDVNVSVAGTPSVLVGALNVDGVDQANQLVYKDNLGGAAIFRHTIAQTFVFDLAGGVSHTIKLRGSLAVAGTTTYNVISPMSGFSFIALPIPPF